MSTASHPSIEKTLRLSIRDFALPVVLKGSLDSHSGLKDKQDVGREIHERIQNERTAEWQDRYQPEKPIQWKFERSGFVFDVQGRMDGILDAEGDRPLIEEIKSTFDLKELRKKIQPLHPYALQLRTYGYLFYLTHAVKPDLQLCLVSSRTGLTDELEVDLNIPAYEEWLEARLQQMVTSAKDSLQRSEQRKKWAASLKFPFPSPRPGQRELIQSIEQGAVDQKHQLLQAPTGLGKTAGVLYPSLRESFSRGQRVIYITPKNTQHAVAEEALDLIASQSEAEIRTLTVTAKSKLCQKAEAICTPRYCEYARNYFDKLHEHKVTQKVCSQQRLKAQDFVELGREYEVCPYELQFEAAATRDLLICDYHYAIQAPSRLTHTVGTEKAGMEGEPILVIDEAHNLPARSMDALSSTLSSKQIEAYFERLEALPAFTRIEMKELLEKAKKTVLSVGQSLQQSMQVDVKVGPFLEVEEEARQLLSRYLETDQEISEKDPVLSFSYMWSDFTEALLLMKEQGQDSPFSSVFLKESRGGDLLRIVCHDASRFLREMHESFSRVIAFSATLKPFHHYLTLGGFDPSQCETQEFLSPFAAKNRKILIIPQASTRYQNRARSGQKIGEAIQRMIALKPGNYMAFFPSFDFLEQVQRTFNPPPGFCVLTQSRNMSRLDIDSVIDHLKSEVMPTVVFAVQGGVLSEGIDFPGNALIGAFIVGPPLPAWNVEMRIRQDYYQKCFGDGAHHASTWPAMAKAIQAAGRVIRTETDRGLIVLFDDRFLTPEFSSSMPKDWYSHSPRELVSNQIVKDIEAFWTGSD